jgi:hypothetical protein
MQALHLLPKRFEFADAVLLGSYPLIGNRFACSISVLFQLLAYLRGEYWISGWAQIAIVAELATRLDRHALEATALSRLDNLINMAAAFRDGPARVRLRTPRYGATGLSISRRESGWLTLLNDQLDFLTPDEKLRRLVFDEMQRALSKCAIRLDSSYNDITWRLRPWGLDQPPAAWHAAVAELRTQLDHIGCPYVVEELN